MMRTPPGHQVGGIVRASLTNKIVDSDLGLAIETGDRNVPLLPLSTPGLTLDLIMPAQNPRPGELWRTADNGLWLATRYHADFDDAADSEDTNDQGWKVRLVSLDDGPYGNTPGTPEEIHRKHVLVECVHRQPVCECQSADVHTRSCLQWPSCDCPVDDQDVTHHLPDCRPGGEPR